MPMVGSTYFWDGSSSHEADLARGWWCPPPIPWPLPMVKSTYFWDCSSSHEADHARLSPDSDKHIISQPRSQNHTFWPEMWHEGWLHARKICAINLKMFEMQYSVCICMSLLAHYHLGWNQKQWKKVKNSENNYISELDKVSLYFTNIFGFREPTGEWKQNMSKI